MYDVVDAADRSPTAFIARNVQNSVRTAALCIGVLIVANTLFLAVRLADALLPKAVIAQALQAGYTDGSMTVDPYPVNMMIGRDQYSDCITAQLALLGGSDAIHDAVAPRLLAAEQVGPDARPIRHYACLELKQYLENDTKPNPQATYARFWQGGASALALALTVLPVDGYRALLLNSTLGLIGLTAVLAALTDRRLLISLSPLLVMSFIFDGQVGYGQLFSYGPPQIALWSIASGMIAFRERLNGERLLLLAVAAGALEAFFDQLISVPLVWTIFLVIAGSLHTWRGPTQTAAKVAMSMGALSAAWMFGFAGSYAVKLLFSMLLLGWAPLHDLIEQLIFRVGTADPEWGFEVGDHVSRLYMTANNLLTLIWNVWRLGFAGERSSLAGCLILSQAACVGWVIAAYRLIRTSRSDRDRFVAVGLPYISAALFLMFWIVIFPEHTLRHAFFMVRSTLILMAGGWGWLAAVKAATLPTMQGSGRVPTRPSGRHLVGDRTPLPVERHPACEAIGRSASLP